MNSTFRLLILSLLTLAVNFGPVTAAEPMSPPNADERYRLNAGNEAGLFDLRNGTFGAPGLEATLSWDPAKLSMNGGRVKFGNPVGGYKYLETLKGKKTVHWAGLGFTELCTLLIGDDGTLLATREKVAATDGTGTRWSSRKLTLAGRESIAFFPASAPKASTPATAAIPPPAPTSDPVEQSGWPALKTRLKGNFEIRVVNPNSFDVKVAIRGQGSDADKGRDFTVPKQGRNSVYLPGKSYDIYFQYSDDPEGLYQGDSFTPHGAGVEIRIVKVVNGNYGIRKVR